MCVPCGHAGTVNNRLPASVDSTCRSVVVYSYAQSCSVLTLVVDK